MLVISPISDNFLTYTPNSNARKDVNLSGDSDDDDDDDDDSESTDSSVEVLFSCQSKPDRKSVFDALSHDSDAEDSHTPPTDRYACDKCVTLDYRCSV